MYVRYYDCGYGLSYFMPDLPEHLRETAQFMPEAKLKAELKKLGYRLKRVGYSDLVALMEAWGQEQVRAKEARLNREMSQIMGFDYRGK